MATEDHSPSTQTPSHSFSSPPSSYHPALAITNVKALIPLVLEVDKVEYSPWATLFRNTAKVYRVLDHIDSSITKPDISDDVWDQLDAIVLQWIYSTISTSLLLKILDDKATTMSAWNRLRDIFQDNKGTRVVHLENQFSTIELSHFSSLSDYCQAIRSISVQLAALGHPISEERLVIQLVRRLNNDDYKVVSALIQQMDPIPSFDKACSMLELDRVSRENNKKRTPMDSALLTAPLPSPSTNTSSRQQPT